jgi:hypothetical protein
MLPIIRVCSGGWTRYSEHVVLDNHTCLLPSDSRKVSLDFISGLCLLDVDRDARASHFLYGEKGIRKIMENIAAIYIIML